MQQDSDLFDDNNRINNENMEKFKHCCKKFTSFFFSRIGLCFIVVGYVVIGGFIFQSIEGKNESTDNFHKNLRTKHLIQTIWNMSKNEIYFHEVNFTAKLRKHITSFQNELWHAAHKGFNGDDSEEIDAKWSYPNSILYSITIITTIGYGHITCKTPVGKIVTIVYALVGIPIMLLCLANIGTSMANAFRFIYSRICCGYCNYIKRRRIMLRTLSYKNASYVISQNNIIPDTSINGNIDKTDILSNTSRFIIDNEIGSIRYNNDLPVVNKSVIEASINDEHGNYRKITVPISMTLFVLGSYIILGAFLFSAWENWTFLEGAYFCFITLSSIGLGDYIPGNSIKDTQSQEKLALVSLYLLIGLALIAMCFNLMQEGVTAKCRRIAVRLGIIDDPNHW